jgi:uncharacterized protein
MTRGAAARLRAVVAGLAGLALAARTAVALDPARYLPPPGAPYGAEEVRVRTTGQFSLGGTLTVPRDGRRRHPTVVLVSGAGRQDRDDSDGATPYRPFYQLADTLSRRGIAVLRLDDRGMGSSTGSIDSTSLVERALDTRAALDFLHARPDVLARKLGLIGMDQGGAIALRIAADPAMVDERMPALAGVVLMGAPGREASATDYFNDPDPIAITRGVHVPVLILSGSLDPAAPAARMDSLAGAFRTGGEADITVRRFEGLDRAFLPATESAGGSPAPPSLRMPPQVLGTIADWVASRLAPGPEAPEPRRAATPHRRRSVRHRKH